jgi:uncharacterized protein involved in exopolysaccharide biosynthesis
MTDNGNSSPSDPKLKSLAEILVRDWITIAIITFIFMVVAGIGSIFWQKQYKSIVQFSVVSDEQHHGGGGGGLMSQFGALASLAGVNIGGGSEKFEALAMLQSRYLSEMYIQQNDLLPILYEKAWDAKAGRWISSDPKEIPTLWKADLVFKGTRTVVQDPKTELVTLAVTWKDPVLAAKWANGLVALTNTVMRDRAIHESQRHLGYLEGEAGKTSLVPVQQALSTLMEQEYKQMMLAGGNEEYALKVIDPGAVPENPSSLRKAYLILGGILGGLFIGCFFVFARASWRGER